jgi:hypothetical protein
MSLLLIDNQTAAATSKPFKVPPGRTPSLKSSGLTGAETVTLQCEINGSFRDATDSAGLTVHMTATKPDLTINADGTYRVTKGVTAATTVQLG